MSKFPEIEDSIVALWESTYKNELQKLIATPLKQIKAIPSTSLSFEKKHFTITYPSNEFEFHEIARFACLPMSGCHAIVLFHSSAVHDFLRGYGIGKLLHKLRVEACIASGFSYAQCTTCASNETQNKILRNNGWEEIKEFMNIKTDNDVIIWLKKLTKD